MSDETKPPGVSDREWDDYCKRRDRRLETKGSPKGEGIEMSDLVGKLASLPPETEEEKAEREKKLAATIRADRYATWRRVCPPEFQPKVDRSLLRNPTAFDKVAAWDGAFPGVLATGGTGTGKTRAAWIGLGRLIVNEGRSLAWFPVARLVAEYERYEKIDLLDEFFRRYAGFNVLFVDDLDKINWQFESETKALFAFYDWVYRERRPCLTTTNKDRAWWAERMGDAFARRLFDDAHLAINF